MTDHFDPYHRWLGISPKYQPADHYRLLGLERFEDDPEVIVDAAERQMTHVRRYALGPNQVLSQTILNELAAAQACLMDPVQKAHYDEGLRQRQTAATPRTAPPPVPAPVIPVTPIAPAAVPTAPKLVKLHKAARPLPAVRKPVGVSPEGVRPQTPGKWYVWRYLAVGIPLGLVLAALFFAFGLGGNRGAVRNVPDGFDAGPVIAPVADTALEPVLPPSPPVGAPPPRMLAIADQDINEGVELQVRLDMDFDAPVDEVRFHLAPGFPAGMRLDESQRMVIWTPDETQGPGEYWITVVATIPDAESRELRESFRVRVREVNTAPSIAPIADQVAEAGQEVLVAITVQDDDLPPNELTFSLLDGPPGAAIAAADGRFSWTPNNSHAGGTWPVRLAVRDNGEPPMAAEARFTIRVTPPPPPPPLAVAPFDAAQARAHQAAWAAHLGQPLEVTNSIGMKLVLIPPGEFMMGSPASEADRDSDETQHRVRITKPFYIGMYEVTQAEYERVMGMNPSSFKTVAGQDTSRFPVEQVSWEDAMEFCRKLSMMTVEQTAGRAYRLPTEAEWEYACRAGTTTPFHFGSHLNGREANCNGNYPYGTTTRGTYLQRPTTVGSYASNGFGLHDMHGNVWEWCSDWYGAYATTVNDPTGPTSASARVYRGSCWYNGARSCQSAVRNGSSPSIRRGYLGCRLAAIQSSR